LRGFAGRREDRAGSTIILLRDHQTARDGADAPLNQARMVVEDKAFDAGILQQ
jgi:hypothetical protein